MNILAHIVSEDFEFSFLNYSRSFHRNAYRSISQENMGLNENTPLPLEIV